MVLNGLEDVVACQSKICFIDGEQGKLLYRGYNVSDLAKHSTFEETSYLLLNGKLPDRLELDVFSAAIADERYLERGIENLIAQFSRSLSITTLSEMAVLASAASCLEHQSLLNQAVRLVGRIPVIAAKSYLYKNNLAETIKPAVDDSQARAFLTMIKGRRPDDFEARIFDICLILQAEHELNASAFAARVVSSTGADIYSAVSSAIGALSGPWHGNANEKVIIMMKSLKDVKDAEGTILKLLGEKKKVPGFGHRVYKRATDPRAVILKNIAREFCEKTGRMNFYRMFEAAEHVMNEERGLKPNVDFYSACVYECMGIPNELFTPIFSVSRAAGWTAHIIEQRDETSRIIRPRAEYTGEADKAYIPIQDR